MDAYTALTNYYNAYDEEGRLATRYGQTEFLTTIHYIGKYLEAGMRILEIGAGTGRYSHFLARQGYEVDAVELMPKNIEIFREKTLQGERIRIFEGSATELSFLESEQYDMTLLLGPMYHLFTEEEKLSALSEAIRVTKPGGVLMIAYCGADAAIHQAGFMRGRAKQLIEDKMLDPVTFRTHSDPKDLFELHRKEDIDRLTANFGNVTRLHYVGTDMLVHYMRGVFEEMDEETFEMYMKYHLTICEREDMVGLTNHVLDILRKELGTDEEKTVCIP